VHVCKLHCIILLHAHHLPSYARYKLRNCQNKECDYSNVRADGEPSAALCAGRATGKVSVAIASNGRHEHGGAECSQTEGPALHYVRGTLLKKAEEVRGGDLSGVFHDVTRATPVRARSCELGLLVYVCA